MNGRGIVVMCGAMFIFAAQDGLSRYLAEEYNVFMVVMIRYWFFMAFVLAISRLRHGSVGAVARTRRPTFQLMRGMLLGAEILVTVVSFTLLGLVEAHAIFAIYPLIVTGLSGPVLGERVGRRRRVAVGAGAIGMLIILQPGIAAFSPYALVPVLGALLFALYNLSNRYATRFDSAATSFFWTGLGGFVLMTAIGPFFWEPMTGADWVVMAILCVTGATGHFLLIKAYELAEASAVQPFAYFQLVFAAAIGVTIWEEALPWTTVLGAAVIVAAGVFTAVRERAVSGESACGV
ncbi:MAG: DMT family transporter [Rhodobacteraceae bacterium]|nr:DMT family transporter [Paracoccaceae bacterium]